MSEASSIWGTIGTWLAPFAYAAIAVLTLQAVHRIGYAHILAPGSQEREEAERDFRKQQLKLLREIRNVQKEIRAGKLVEPPVGSGSQASSGQPQGV